MPRYLAGTVRRRVACKWPRPVALGAGAQSSGGILTSTRNPGSHPTNRMVMGQIVVCLGCCCGRPDKGHPAVPLDWLKAEWKRRLLQKKIHLSISGCLGPCDQTNVVAIITPARSIWLGGIERDDQYRDLLDWASACERAGQLRPLPAALARLEFTRFQATGQARAEVA